MPTFKYRAQESNGKIQAGYIETADLESAAMALRERGYEILLLEEKKHEAPAKGGFSFLNRIKQKDLVVFARTLSVMFSASVPLVDSLRNLSRQAENPRFGGLLHDVANEVEGGAQFSDALEKYSDVFGDFFVNMIRSGETSGQLTEVLEYLADQMEKDYDLNSKIRGAMIYPAFIMSGLLVVAFIMMAFVVPKLTAILEEANVALPLSTRLLIIVANFFQNFWWLIIIMVVGAAAFFRFWITTPGGRYLWDRFKMSIPIFGNLYRRIYVVRFSRSLATLSKGGVDMVSSLEIVSGVMGNEVWKHLVFETIREVNDGNSIVAAMAREKYVPKIMVQMLGVGEESGKIEEVLGRLSSFFQREIDNLVGNLVSLIEPVVMILLGVGVGIMVSAILLPLYNLSSAA